MITRYIDFLKRENMPILENVQQAKDFLKKNEIKRRKSLGIDDKLTIEEEKQLYTDPYFLKIKDMLAQNPGLVYLFTKTFFEDFRKRWEESEYEKGLCLEELKNIYEDLKSKKDLWGSLPMNFDKYASLRPDEEDDRISIERLTDDWEDIKSIQYAKKIFLNRLLPFQKAWFKDPSETLMKILSAIGKGFSQLGMKSDGTIDQEENKRLNDSFFVNDGNTGYIGRLQKPGDLIRAAESHIINSSKNGYRYLLDKIEKANNQCGLVLGVDLVYEQDGFMVVEVKSYAANKIINDNVTHCIARQDPSGLGWWNKYVDLSKMRRQYYIYDFNISEIDTRSVIGLTIDGDGGITHANLKDNTNFIDKIEQYIKRNIPRDVFKPYTKEEKKQIMSRLDANKIMRLNNLSFDDLRSAVERGGDINIDNGLPLKNAIDAGNYQSVELLVKAGASLNLRTDFIHNLSTKASAQTNLKIVELLVSSGHDLDKDGYSTVLRIKGVSIFSIIKMLLSSGLDPNMADGRLLRDGISRKDVEWVSELSKYKLNFAARNYIIFETLITQGESDNANSGELKEELFDIVLKKLKGDPIFKDESKLNGILENIIFRKYWYSSGEKSEKVKRIKFLLDKLIEYGAKSSYDFVIEACKERLDVKYKIEKEKNKLKSLLNMGEIEKSEYDSLLKKVERKSDTLDKDERIFVESLFKALSKK